MARRTERVVIDADGSRDKGKVFVVEEMPAMRAEEWADRLLFAIGNANAAMPDDLRLAGMAGLAALSMRAFMSINFAEAKPLLAEMLDCVRVVPDLANPQFSREWVSDDFEEVATIWMLRERVFALHTGFSMAAGLSNLGAAVAAAIKATSPNTATSPSSSASS